MVYQLRFLIFQVQLFSSLSSINIAKLLCIRIYQTFIQIIFLKHYIMSRLKFFSCSAWGRHKVEANILKKNSISSKAQFIFELFRLTENNATKRNRDISRRDTEPIASRKGSVLWILIEFFIENLSSFPCCNQ